MEIIRSRAPIVRLSKETFHEHIVVGGDRRVVAFEKEITWLRETETQMEILHGGQVLQQGGCYTDFYGLMTSMRDPLDDVASVMQRYKVGPESSLEVRVRCTVSEQPVLTSDETRALDVKEASVRKHYFALPSGWSLKVEEDGETRWPRLGSVEVAKTVVWSNKFSELENAEALSTFQAKWAITQEPVAA